MNTATPQSAEIQKAVALLSAGKRTEARLLLLAMDSKIQDARTRLEFVDASLAILDPIRDNEKIISLLMDGLVITASSGLTDLQAYFMARAAEATMFPVSKRRYRMANLKLAPNWIEFATEADKKEFEALSAEVKTLEDGIDTALMGAESLAKKCGDKKTQATVLMIKASVEGSRYMQHKADCMRGTFRAKLWGQYEFMRHPVCEYLMMFSNGDAQRLNVQIESFTRDFLKAASLFAEIDDSSAGNAYHNLANDLTSAHHFRAAEKYLTLARKIAQKYNDQVLLRHVNVLAESIKTKTKSTPDFINGETRNLDSL